jgi:hypothetical protein
MKRSLTPNVHVEREDGDDDTGSQQVEEDDEKDHRDPTATPWVASLVIAASLDILAWSLR